MSDSTPPPAQPEPPAAPPPVPPAAEEAATPLTAEQPAAPPPSAGQPYPTYAGMAAEAGITPQPYGGALGGGPAGKIRSTGMAILLEIVTLGIYGLYYFYSVHKEMKEHSGQGIGGPLALVLAIFVGFVNPYITSSEVGNLYARRGQPQPVTAKTGLWYFPGMLIIVGPFIWFIKTNNALNEYWQSVGATTS